jgi:hypothetical protein
VQIRRPESFEYRVSLRSWLFSWPNPGMMLDRHRLVEPLKEFLEESYRLEMHGAEDALNVLRSELGGMHGWQH